ncbi:Sucrose-6-phosphate hydrolase [compost metagenome]
MKPAEEVTALRGSYYPAPVRGLNNQKVLVTANAEAVEVQLAWDLSASTAEQFGMALGDGLRIYVDNQAQRLVVERSYPKYSLEGTRSIPLPANSLLSLRIFIDCSSVEVFVNDGDACLSSRIYPQPDQRDISLFANHGIASLQDAGYWSLDR